MLCNLRLRKAWLTNIEWALGTDRKKENRCGGTQRDLFHTPTQEEEEGEDGEGAERKKRKVDEEEEEVCPCWPWSCMFMCVCVSKGTLWCGHRGQKISFRSLLFLSTMWRSSHFNQGILLAHDPTVGTTQCQAGLVVNEELLYTMAGTGTLPCPGGPVAGDRKGLCMGVGAQTRGYILTAMGLELAGRLDLIGEQAGIRTGFQLPHTNN